MGKIGKWGETVQWPTETLSGRPFVFPQDWPQQTRNIGKNQFVILDFGLKATGFDIDAAIAALKPAKRVKHEQPESTDESA